MKRLLTAAVALSLLAAAGPAVAAPAPRFAPCKAPSGATVVKAGAAAVERAVPTPVGALLIVPAQPVGTFYLDLGGRPTSATGQLTFVLAWDTELSDYDTVIDGKNQLGSRNPERTVVKAQHCRPVQVDVKVFLGLPTDQLTLSTKGA